MKVQTMLSTFALAGVLLTVPVYGNDPSTARNPSDPHPAMTDEIIEGQVAGVDHETGRLVLNTAKGPVSVVTSNPDALAQIEVGDEIRVSFATDDRN